MNKSDPGRFSYWQNENLVKIIGISVIILISVFLGFFRIRIGEQHVDFYQVKDVFAKDWGGLLSDFSTSEGLFGGFQAPLYFLLAKVFGTAMGEQPYILASFSTIAYSLCIITSWVCFPKITGEKSVPFRWIYTLLIALAPMHIWWAQTAKYNMWFTFFSILCLTAGFFYLNKQTTSSGIWFLATSILVIYTHYIGFLFVAGQWMVFLVFALVKVISKREFHFLARTLTIGFLTFLLSIPLLIVGFNSLQLRLSESYHFTERFPTLSSIVYGGLIEWLFGHGLLPGKSISQSLSIFKDLGFRNSTLLDLSPIFILSSVIILVLVSVVISIWMIISHPSRRFEYFYFLVIPLSTWFVSQVIHLSFRFSYLGVGTWALLTFMFSGWMLSKKKILPYMLGGIFIGFFIYSLGNYYSNMPYRYPGMGLVVEYLEDHPQIINVMVDDWLIDTRGTDHPYQFPDNLNIQTINSSEPFPSSSFFENTVVFLAGGSSDSIQRLDTATPAISWIILETWRSLEMDERSIQVILINKDQ